MTNGQKTTLALVMLFAAAAYARNKLQKIETHSGASPGVVTIKGDDFQVATGGSNGDCLLWDDTTDAGVDWGACAAGGGDSVSVDSAATTDPDFQDGDVDFTYAAGVVTATVGCTGCVDAADLAANSLTPADLDAVGAAGVSEDEYCLTYEHSTTEFQWQVCSSGGGDSITVNSGATVDPNFLNGDIDFTYAGTDITATVGCSQCVSYAEVQQVSATDRILGRDTAGAGVIEEIGISAVLDMLTSSPGSVPFRDSASWSYGALQVDTSTYAVYPPLDDARNLGRTDVRWNELFVTHIDNNGGTITVDANLNPDADLGQALGDGFNRWSGVYTEFIGNDGASTPIDLAGGFLPINNNSYDLGSSSFIFNEVFSSSTYINNLDGVGAVDMDYGSADITDHTFTTDGTGDSEIVLPTGSIGSTEILDNDLTASDLAADSVGTSELSAAAVCEAWPVDSIFISMSSTNPGTSLGCGTWSAFGAGRVLVSLDSGDTSWDAAGETGGSKTHNHTGTTGAASAGATQRGTTASTLTLAAHTHGFTTNSDNGIAMPYIAVYMWRRTA